MMKYIAAFLMGAFAGAAAALLLAPSSGEELRSNIKAEVEAQTARAREEWQKGLEEVHERMNKLKQGSPEIEATAV
jgi:gas vesicle protein